MISQMLVMCFHQKFMSFFIQVQQSPYKNMITQIGQNLESISLDGHLDSEHQRSRQKDKQQTKKCKGRPLKRIKEDLQSQEKSQQQRCQQRLFKSIYKTIEYFLIFYQSIQIQKGFILNESQRKKYTLRHHERSFAKYGELNPNHSWNYNEQKRKLAQMLAFLNINLKLSEKLQKYIIQVSSHLASQFTKEYYRIMLEIYLIHLKKTQLDFNGRRHEQLWEAELKQLAEEIKGNKGMYYLFSLTFFRDRIPSFRKKNQPDIAIYQALIKKIAIIIEKLMKQ